jgi:predicted O-linked N-acetylglucosamine transferase (SPINDLY family)
VRFHFVDIGQNSGWNNGDVCRRPGPVTADQRQAIARQFAAALDHHKAGRLAEAERLYRQVCAADPNHAGSFHRLGVVAHQLGRLDAIELVERAVTLKPDVAEMHNDLGGVLAARGKFGEAAACFERAAVLKPDFADAHYNRGLALGNLGRFGEAAGCFQRVLTINPQSASAHVHLGHALRAQGRREDAVVHYRHAAALMPNSAGAYNNLANALMELGRTDEALAQFDRAIALAPDFAPAYYNRGIALRGQSRFAEATASFARAAAIKPDFLSAKLAACVARLPILYEDEPEIAARRADYAACLHALHDEIERSAAPGELADAIGAHQPFYLAYQGANDRDLQAVYGAIVCRVMAARYGPAKLPAAPAPGEPVRVAIVSGFFRRHSNWKIPIKGWLSQLDRSRFRLFGYYTADEADAETEAAAALCERFVRGPLALDAWRQAILADAPHVILYPEVGMDRVSAQLAAQRLAPVQCNAWGHPDTSGLPTLDYYLSSDLMEPPDGAQHYTERLIRLPNLSIYYEPPDAAPAAADRAALGLRASATVFWCAQSLPKYLPQYDQVFPRIARDAGDCQFTFIQFPGAAQITALFRERLERAFATFGLNAADHCVFLPRLKPQEFVAAIGACDAVLDSIGWSGCNSVLESLVHDLPIVTLTGPLMRGRHATAILAMMNVQDTVTASVDGYAAAAVRIARDAEWRSSLRSKIARNKHRLYRDSTVIAALEDFLAASARGLAPS